MAISFNGTSLATNINAVVFNGTAVSKVVFNGTTVWEKQTVTFTTSGAANGCPAFTAAANTFSMNGGGLITYTASGFIGSTGNAERCTDNTNIITSGGGIIVDRADAGAITMTTIDGYLYFAGYSYRMVGGCMAGLNTTTNTNVNSRTSELYGYAETFDSRNKVCVRRYTTNILAIAR